MLCSEWLGEELGGSLGQPVQGVGEGSVTGGTRQMVVEQMDKIWGSVLKKGLESHPDQSPYRVQNSGHCPEFWTNLDIH